MASPDIEKFRPLVNCNNAMPNNNIIPGSRNFAFQSLQYPAKIGNLYEFDQGIKGLTSDPVGQMTDADRHSLLHKSISDVGKKTKNDLSSEDDEFANDTVMLSRTSPSAFINVSAKNEGNERKTKQTTTTQPLPFSSDDEQVEPLDFSSKKQKFDNRFSEINSKLGGVQDARNKETTSMFGEPGAISPMSSSDVSSRRKSSGESGKHAGLQELQKLIKSRPLNESPSALNDYLFSGNNGQYGFNSTPYLGFNGLCDSAALAPTMFSNPNAMALLSPGNSGSGTKSKSSLKSYHQHHHKETMLPLGYQALPNFLSSWSAAGDLPGLAVETNCGNEAYEEFKRQIRQWQLHNQASSPLNGPIGRRMAYHPTAFSPVVISKVQNVMSSSRSETSGKDRVSSISPTRTTSSTSSRSCSPIVFHSSMSNGGSGSSGDLQNSLTLQEDALLAQHQKPFAGSSPMSASSEPDVDKQQQQNQMIHYNGEINGISSNKVQAQPQQQLNCSSTESSALINDGSNSNSNGANCGPKKRGRSLPDELKDEAYWERRRKNNEAAKRSRDARRAKEDEIAIRAAFLEQENLKLRVEVAALKSETAKLRCLLYNS